MKTKLHKGRLLIPYKLTIFLFLFIGLGFIWQSTAQCLWTVEVSPTNFYDDEISWGLTDEEGNIILEGYDNGGWENPNPPSGTFTAMAEGPLDFHISTIGSINDNSAIYSVANEIEVVASGALEGGQESTHEDLTCMDEDCTEAVAGTIEGPESACNEVEFDLVAAGASSGAAGLSGQWQTSTDDESWSDIDGANSKTLTTSISEDTYFRYSMTCTAGGEDVSDSYLVSLNTNPEDCYCTPTASSSTYDYLNSVVTDGAETDLSYSIDSGTGDDYIDQTASILEAYSGQQFNISIGYTGGTYTVGIWVDWDKNGSFGDENERLFLSNGTSPQATQILVPEDLEIGEYRMRVRGAYDYNGNILDDEDNFACNDQTYGTTVDFTFRVIEIPTCPKPTDLSVSDISAESAIIDWEGSVSDYNLEWGAAGFESGEGNLIENVSNPYDLENLDPNTTYDIYVQTNCDEDNISSWTGPVTFTTSCLATDVPFLQDFEEVSPPDLPNCGSFETNSGNTWKTNTFAPGFSGNVLNYSYHISEEADSWYFTQGINLEEGVNYQISYKYGNSSTWEENLKVAYGNSANSAAMVNEIEDHLDILGTFTNEIVFTVDASGVYYFGFQAHSEANKNQIYVDDIAIVVLSTCENVVAGTPVEDEINICPAVAFTIEVEGSTLDDGGVMGVSGQWEASTDAGESWSAIEDATETVYTVQEGISENTQYRFVISCDEDESEDISPVIMANINSDISECYCEPSFPSGVEPITFVQVTDDGGNIMMENSSSASSDDAYEDFTDISVQLIAGDSYDIAVEGNTAGSFTNKLMVYVDWNQDGSFSEDEAYALTDLVNSTGEDGQQATGSLSVPEDAITGETRMRVIKRFSTVPDACNAAGYGQAEDYTVIVNSESSELCEPQRAEHDGPGGVNPYKVDAITSVGLGSLNDQDQSTDSYIDRTGDTDEPSLALGQSYTLTIQGNGGGNHYAAAWIDLNDNNEFEDAELLGVVYTTAPGSASIDFEISESATLGQHRLRVVWQFSNDNPEFPDPCTEEDWGQTKDYSILIVEEQEVACEAPEDLAVDDVTESSAMVIWEPGMDPEEAQGWEVVYGLVGAEPDGQEVASVMVEDAPFVELEGLESNTTYDVFVRTICGEDQASNWEGPVSFTTLEEQVIVECDMPTDLQLDEVSDTMVEISWTPGGQETSWLVIYGEAGFEDDGDFNEATVLEPQYVIDGLDPETDYEVYVIAICDEEEMNYSEPTERLGFTTEPMSVSQQYFEDFSFYPNPVQNQLHLQSQLPLENVVIHNLLGQKLMDQTLGSMEAQIDTQSLPVGVYLMTVTIEGNQKTFRLVKK